MITATNLTSTNPITVFTATQETAITTLMICNHTTSTSCTVQAWVVPAGTVQGANQGNSNQILKDLVIVGADTFVMDMEKLVLSSGDYIILQANGADIVNSVISSMSLT